MTRSMLQRLGALASTVVLVVVAWLGCGGHDEPAPAAPPATQARRGEVRPPPLEARPAEPARGARPTPTDLPPEAYEVLASIARGGPFPYRQDGGEFQNREGRLPPQPRGHYREYTVPTPGSKDRGPRRIVTGGAPPATYFYTDDHYRTFRPVQPDVGPR